MANGFAKEMIFLLGGALKRKGLYIGSSLNFLSRKRNLNRNYLDYIRLATLELVSNEIYRKNLPGNVAELGVYKGGFAKHINAYFPDRKFYLFDTFEGFHLDDVQNEKAKNYSG